jgi:hypothetical protein
MTKAKAGGKVERQVLNLLEDLLHQNRTELSQLGRLLVDKETDQALALLMQIADRNGMAATAATLLSENLISEAELYLLTEIRRLQKP